MANKKDGSCTLRILEKTNIIYLLWFLSNNILSSIVLVSNIDHIGSSGNCRSLERPTRCGLANRSSSKWPIANRLHGVSWLDLYWSVTLGQAKLFEDFVNLLQTWHFFAICHKIQMYNTYLYLFTGRWKVLKCIHLLNFLIYLRHGLPHVYTSTMGVWCMADFLFIFTILRTSQYSTWIPFFFFCRICCRYSYPQLFFSTLYLFVKFSISLCKEGHCFI